MSGLLQNNPETKEESKEWARRYRWNKVGHELIVVEGGGGYMGIHCTILSSFMYIRKIP